MSKPEIKLVVSYTIVSGKGSLDGTRTFENISDVYSWLLNATCLMTDLERLQQPAVPDAEPQLEQDNAR